MNYFIKSMAMLLCFLLTLAVPAAEGQLVDDHPGEEYYDPNLPKRPEEIKVKPYTGERYDVEVPDTMDLTYFANEAINVLSKCIADEAHAYCIYHLIWAQFNPPIFEVGHMSNLSQNAKWSESIVYMRSMTGSNWNTEGDQKLLGSIVRIIGRDGLCYHPVKNLPWAYIDPISEKAGKPYSDMFCEARQIRALATWYEHDKNPMWKELADRKVKRMSELVIKKGDTCYFKFMRGYSPWYKETGEGKVIALGDVGQVFDSMTGPAAAAMVCWVPHACATWYKMSGNKQALELARGLARYLYEDPGFFDRKTKKFNGGGFAPHALNSMCSYALIAGDKEIAEWVKLGYEQFIADNDPDHAAEVWNLHACDYGDMLQIACMLTRNGYADYWEDIDRWIRNGYSHRLTTQAQIDASSKGPITRLGDPKTTATLNSLAYWVKGELPLNKPWPHLLQPEDGQECRRGACAGAGCCQANLTRGLYLVWDSIIEKSENGPLKVNLLLNRASPWADIDSWIPYEGKAKIKIKKDQQNVLVRIPRWTDNAQVACKINGEVHEIAWGDNNYLKCGSRKAGDEIMIQFPMKEWDIQAKIKMAGGQRVGTLKLDYVSVNNVSDDFSSRPAGKLDEVNTGNNTGKNGMPWRCSTSVGVPVMLDGKSALELPITGNWNQYIDTCAMPPFVTDGVDCTFAAIFEKTAKGDVAMGFIRDLTWDTGTEPKGQRLFKLKNNHIYIASYYDKSDSDEDTGVQIVPDKLQGLMIRKDAEGNVRYYYQDSGDKSTSSTAWREITPATSPGGNLKPLHIGLGQFGINSLGDGAVENSIVKMKGNTIVDITNNVKGFPVADQKKYVANEAPMKKVSHFVSNEHYIWY